MAEVELRRMLRRWVEKPEASLLLSSCLILLLGGYLLDPTLILMSLLMWLSLAVPLGLTSSDLPSRLLPPLPVSFLFGLLFVVGALRSFSRGIFAWQVWVLLAAGLLSLHSSRKWMGRRKRTRK
ncbi:MAG: hypothetical protein DSO04_01850 [Hadesarchaea archaeon]|nr:MAG: hypothetical protein DSO04_01850 [Hadesarchaea archaeon]